MGLGELGIPYRDGLLFVNDKGKATNQRAAILLRNHRIVVKTEAVKGVITEENLLLVKSKRGKVGADLAGPWGVLPTVKVWTHLCYPHWRLRRSGALQSSNIVDTCCSHKPVQ